MVEDQSKHALIIELRISSVLDETYELELGQYSRRVYNK